MIIFKLRGDSEFIAAAKPEAMNSIVTVENFLAERDNSDPMCRWEKAKEWKEIDLLPYPGYSYEEGEPFRFNDVISAGASILGASIIVSDQARLKLMPYIGKECVFLPVHLLQAPQKYWMIYITNILDCLNIKDSKFTNKLYPPRRIKHYSFDIKKLANVYLFRLPGHFDYLDDKDLATQRFLDLTQNLGIGGFEFWDLNKPDQDPIVTGD
jgi:hypothetical protein